ncbi:unnamed protein product [Hydatigera taeniaeformis]|uniref:Transmembrane protein n=1 Tax=Hydatigena taeniaeformis TaxID=6205 RepID=A0A0R3WTK9_HYDTA|nr:unnamed protein product [Hydatigera taeniaeformis]
MNTKVAHIFAALLTALLLLIPVGFHGFDCSGYIFSAECGGISYLQILGKLTLTAGVFACMAALFIAISISCHTKWLNRVIISVVSLSTIFSATTIFLYYTNTKAWSPFMASMAMTISIVHTAILLIDFLSNLIKSS